MNEENKNYLSKFSVFTMLFGTAVGSGIFMMMGYGISYTGRSVILALIVGGIFNMLSNYYQVVTMSFVPFKGGTYSQNLLYFPPIFLGYQSVASLITGVMFASYGLGIASYLGSLIPVLVGKEEIVACVVTIFFFILSAFPANKVGKIQDIMTICLFGGLGLFIVWGFFSVDFSLLTEPGFFMNGPAGFFTACSLMGYASSGPCGLAVNLAATVKNPRKTLPKMVFIATGTVLFLYMLMAIVSTCVLPIEQVVGQNLSVVAATIFPKAVYYIFLVAGPIFALTTTLYSQIMGIRYPFVQICRDNWYPKCMSKVTKNEYPVVIMVIACVITCIMIFTGLEFDQLTALLNVSGILIMFWSAFNIIFLPRRFPKLWKSCPFHMPYPLYVVFCLLIIGCVVMANQGFFQTLTLPIVLGVFLFMAVCFGYSVMRVKTGAVSLENLRKQKEEAIAEAEAMEEKGEA